MQLNEDGNLIISGIATTNRVDAEGHSVTLSPNGFNTMYKQYIKDGGKILAEHGRTREYNHKVVGRCISLIYPDDYSIDTPTIKPLEVKIIVEVFDPQAIQDLLDGKFKGFSIKCEAQSFYKSGSYYVITSGIMHEISICQFPVNRDCELHIVTDESIMEQFGFKKGDSVQALGKQGVITNIYTKAEQPYYEIQYPQFTKSMIIPQNMLEKTNNKEIQNKPPSGCVMAMIDPSNFDTLISQIDEKDTYTTEDSYTSGIVDDHHVTILYGLESSVTTQDIIDKLESITELTVEPSNFAVFKPENKEYEVLVIECKKTDALLKANEACCELPYKNDYPEYKPHITLAYLIKGKGQKYIDSLSLEKTIYKAQKIVFSPDDSDEIDTVIEFEKSKKPTIKVTFSKGGVGSGRKGHRTLKRNTGDTATTPSRLEKKFVKKYISEFNRRNYRNPEAHAKVRITGDQVRVKFYTGEIQKHGIKDFISQAGRSGNRIPGYSVKDGNVIKTKAIIKSEIVTKAGKKGRSGRKKRGGVKRYDPAKFSVASRAQQNSYVSAQRSQSGDRYKDIGRVRTGGIWDMMKAYTCTISNQKINKQRR